MEFLAFYFLPKSKFLENKKVVTVLCASTFPNYQHFWFLKIEIINIEIINIFDFSKIFESRN